MIRAVDHIFDQLKDQYTASSVSASYLETTRTSTCWGRRRARRRASGGRRDGARRHGGGRTSCIETPKAWAAGALVKNLSEHEVSNPADVL